MAVLAFLYTIAFLGHRRRVLAAAIAVAEIGVVMAVARWGPLDDKVQAAFLMTGTVTAAWVLGIYARTRRAYLTSILDRAVTAEHDRDSRAQIAVAAERARMAREMHDVIAHSMSVMITLSDAAAAVESDLESRDAMRETSLVGRQALTEMRRLLGVLRNGEPVDLEPAPDFDAVTNLVSSVRAAGVPVELDIEGDFRSAPASAHLVAFRIVQEGLTNVIKHGVGVRNVCVAIAFADNRMTLRVTDDGRPSAVARSDGFGLIGMRERAAIFGADVNAGPLPGCGWQVETTLHLDSGTPTR